MGIINSHVDDGISDREVSLFFVSRSQLQVSPINDDLLKPRRSHADDTLDKPVYFLWSREGNLDKPNHIVPVMCAPDAQHKDDVKKMSTIKSTGAKQNTLFTFLMPPFISRGVKRTVDHSPAVLPEKLRKVKKKWAFTIEEKSPIGNPSPAESFYVSGRNSSTGLFTMRMKTK